MAYDYLKALHIIFVVTWFAGLFYLPRLFIYFTEAAERPENEKKILQDQFLIMQKRLWYGITWPSCILTLIFGFSLLHHWFPLKDNPWLIVKLTFVGFLFLYHLSLGYIYKKHAEGLTPYSSFQLRIWNEVSTIFLVAVVFLVVLKNVLSMGYGLLGLIGFVFLLMGGILTYRKIRSA
ncbi:MAG: CopD family protein [Halobacteriovoraceae bacterium]|nr:CopD family protein [Halobacteriovoraceae bacterium]